jgi:6-phosphogluconate dehydrogenase
MKEQKSNIGLIGLAVMGANLARNLANHGSEVLVYNRTYERTEEFLNEYGSKNLKAAETLEEFVRNLESPRKIIVMVKAGDPVDQVIGQLVPLLDKGDIIIDCGNSFFRDTQRRFEGLQKQEIHFVGCGVSGGEEGALNGPAMMLGGDREVWEKELKSIFEPITAKDFSDGQCISYFGKDGAGHYVKMVHNGIEYGVMQIIAEIYFILSQVYKLDAGEISKIFEKLNAGKLKSYLFEIAVNVLRQKDPSTKGFLIDSILDKAGSKGTGMWTSVDALERGLPLSGITSAVTARYISGLKSLRVELSKDMKLTTENANNDSAKFINLLEDAIYLAVLSMYAQGFELINLAAKEEGWFTHTNSNGDKSMDFAEVVRVWQGGCIIRADLLKAIETEYRKENKYTHLFKIPYFQNEIAGSISKLRSLAAEVVRAGVPIPSIYAGLEYIESIRQERLPANMIQGLRDYFGAHTYERVDKEGSFHTQWE